MSQVRSKARYCYSSIIICIVQERYPIQQGQIAALSCEERIVDAAADPKPTAFFNDVKTALIEDEQV